MFLRSQPGKPRTLPGRQSQFDISRSPSKRLQSHVGKEHGRDFWMAEYESLSLSMFECRCQVVFIPNVVIHLTQVGPMGSGQTLLWG
jgi:hypothetical protein